MRSGCSFGNLEVNFTENINQFIYGLIRLNIHLMRGASSIENNNEWKYETKTWSSKFSIHSDEVFEEME